MSQLFDGVVVIGAGAVVAADAVVVIGAAVVDFTFNCPSVAVIFIRLVPVDVPCVVEGEEKFSDRIVAVNGWLGGVLDREETSWTTSHFVGGWQAGCKYPESVRVGPKTVTNHR